VAVQVNTPDDPVKVSNARGTVVLLTTSVPGRCCKSYQYRKNGNGFLDKQGFFRAGRAVEGMDVVDAGMQGTEAVSVCRPQLTDPASVPTRLLGSPTFQGKFLCH
jgi:hypothetical protein